MNLPFFNLRRRLIGRNSSDNQSSNISRRGGLGGLKVALGLMLGMIAATPAWSFVYITNSQGQNVVWPNGSIVMHIKADNSATLSDGTTRATSIRAAMTDPTRGWNHFILNVQFAPVIDSPGNGSDGNGVNEMFFSSSPYNYTWDNNTLAITTGWLTGSQRTEGDVIFNTAFAWDSYRGALHSSPIDLQRVALHELGHVLGLDHPDEHGQSVAALMNSVISDLDSLQPDDIAGAQGLYGVGNPTPPAFALQPANQSIISGSGVQFNVGPTGWPTPALQWQRLPSGTNTWADIPQGNGYDGVTTPTLTVYSTATFDGDQFRCVATNASGSATSNAATLSITAAAAPVFTSVSPDLTVNQNQQVSIPVAVTGTPTPVLTWERWPSGSYNTTFVANDTTGTYSGASTTTLSFIATAAMNGDQFRCTAFNQAGSVQTRWIQLVVGTKSLPTFSPQPADQTLTEGQTATVSTGVVSSAAATTYWQYHMNGSQQWQLWDYWDGINTATLSFPVGLAMNGYQLRCVATNGFGTSYSQPTTLTVTRDKGTILAAAIDYSHLLLLKPDHTLWASGDNSFGGGISSICYLPVQIATNVAKISAGYGNSYYLKTDNTLWAIGKNGVGQLGDGTTYDRSTPYQVATGVTAIVAGPQDALYLKSDSTLWGMGANYNGQLGDGTTTERHSPIQIASGVRTAASGGGMTLFVKTDNSLWAMGANDSGQLGDGTTTERHSPVKIADGVSAVAAGDNISAFIKTDGSLWTMGNNQDGQVGDGTGLQRNSPVQVASNVIAVAAKGATVMFIKADGTLWGMGSNGSGQMGTGTYSNGIYFPIHVAEQVSAVSCGQQCMAVVKTDGSLWLSGFDRDGCFGDGGYAIYSANSYATPLELFGPDPIAQAPVITQQPASGTFNAGDDILLHVDATGTPHPTFQWRKDNINLDYVTDPYLHIYNQPGGSGVYTVVVSNPSGSVTSQPATIVVLKVNSIGYSSYSLSASSGAGGRVLLSTTVTNSGTNAWGPNHALWLVDSGGHHVASASLNGVSPGSSVKVQLNFFAPETPGDYTYTLQGEQAGVGPFQYQYPISVYLAVVANTQAAKDDLDGDRLPDLIWQNSTTGERVIWQMGAGEYLSSTALGTISTDWSIAGTGDFNGDLHNDLVWQNSATGERVIWFMNGTSFASATSLGVVSTDWSIAAVADYDGDGHPDLIWQNTATGERVIWLMNGTNVVGTPTLPTTSVQWSIMGAADFNGDGKADLIWQNSVTGNCYVDLRNQYGLSTTLYVGGGGPGMVISGAVDFNGDGLQDILWTNPITGERTVALRLQYGGWTSQSLGTIPVEWSLFHPQTIPPKVGADFNADLRSDLVWENTSTGERYFWLMNGTAFASSVFLQVVPTQWHIAGNGDFDRDGQPDLVWENTATGERYLWLMHGTNFRNNPFLGVISTDWRIAATGDFDGDGNTDLVWQNTSTGERYLWLMNGTNFVSGVSLGTVAPEWRIAGSEDFNGDGKPDLVWENTSTGERYLWLMDGTSYGSSVYLGTLPTEWRIAGTGDFNHDGQTDLIWQNTSTGERYLWLMNGTSFNQSVFLGVIPVEWQISQ